MCADTETGLPGNHRQMNGSTFAGQRFEAGYLTSASTFKFRKVAHELCEVGNTCSLFQVSRALVPTHAICGAEHGLSHLSWLVR